MRSGKWDLAWQTRNGGVVRLYAMPSGGISAVIIDCDDTLYTNSRYRAHCAEIELQAISKKLGWPQLEAGKRLDLARNGLSDRLGRPARRSETVVSLGLDLQWWNETRARLCEPERFLERNPELNSMVDEVRSRGWSLAVASNSPTLTTRRVLAHVGRVGLDSRNMKDTLVEGPDTTGATKPDPVFFQRVASKLGVSPTRCISVGDDVQNDAIPAIDSGMGAIIVEDGSEFSDVIRDLCRGRLRKPLDLDRLALSQIRPGQISVMAISGRAGAGKTRFAEHLECVYRRHSVPAVILGLDCFLRKSSRERYAWLAEGRALGAEEYARRSNQMEWWDFDWMQEALGGIRRGECVQLEGVYDRNNGGELSGTRKIESLFRQLENSRGGVCIVEGVAIAHQKLPGDHFVYVWSHPSIRPERLLRRDVHRDANAAAERFRITQAFEDSYFPRFSSEMDTVVDCTGASPFVRSLRVSGMG